MEVAMCSSGMARFRRFSLLELQNWEFVSTRGMANLSTGRGRLEIAKTRIPVPQAETRGYVNSGYGGTGRVRFKDIYKRRDAEDDYRRAVWWISAVSDFWK